MAISFCVSLLLFRFFLRKDLKAAVRADHGSRRKEILKGQETSQKVFNCSTWGNCYFRISRVPSYRGVGAVVLLVITKANPEKVMQEVDWITLIFFTGLFIIVGAAEHAGLIEFYLRQQ